MAARLPAWVVEKVAANLKLPKKSIYGRLTLHYLKKNAYLESNAVNLCNIKPDYKVLELGFGPGHGLEAAYTKVKDGKGVVYGIDPSMYMVETAAKRVRKAARKKKVMLFHGSATNIPLNTDTVDRVFHTNCYYFWPSMRVVMREIYRVMKPGGLMVTVLSKDSLQASQEAGYLKYAKIDPVKYMTCLENYGFEGVHLEYMHDSKTGKPFQAIFSEISEKPAHHVDMLSDDDSDVEEEAAEPVMDKERK